MTADPRLRLLSGLRAAWGVRTGRVKNGGKREGTDGRSALVEILSARRPLGGPDRARAAAARARDFRPSLRRPAGAAVHGQADQLRGVERPCRPGRGGLPEARSRTGRACRSLHAEHAALRDRPVRCPQGGRSHRELFAARCAEHARVQGRGQRDGRPRHPGPRGRVSAGREASGFDASETARRRRVCRIRRRPGAGDGGPSGARPALCRRIRRAACRVPRSSRQRRTLRGPPDQRSDRYARGHPIHRRHDRPAEGRDADPRQPRRGLRAVHGDGHAHGPACDDRGRRAHALRTAALPHLRAVRSSHTRLRRRGGGDPASAFRSSRGRQGHRAKEGHRLSRRSDHASRSAEPSGYRQVRSQVAQVLRLRRRAAAGRRAAAVPGGDRRPFDRRLGHVGDGARRHVHPPYRRWEAGLLRPADAAPRDEIRRRHRPFARPPARRARRDLRQGAECDEGLLEEPRGDRRLDDGGRLFPHRRHRLHGRRRFRLHCRPHQGHAARRRLQRLPAHHRGSDLQASVGRGGERRRCAGPLSRARFRKPSSS